MTCWTRSETSFLGTAWSNIAWDPSLQCVQFLSLTSHNRRAQLLIWWVLNEVPSAACGRHTCILHHTICPSSSVVNTLILRERYIVGSPRNIEFSLIFLISITPPTAVEYIYIKIRNLRKNFPAHGVTTFLLTEMIADRFIILHKLTHQSKNRQHWSRTLERKVHRLFSKDVCGKHYVLKMYCFIFIPGVGGSRQLVGGRHPLVFSSEWCVIVRTAGM